MQMMACRVSQTGWEKLGEVKRNVRPDFFNQSNVNSFCTSPHTVHSCANDGDCVYILELAREYAHLGSCHRIVFWQEQLKLKCATCTRKLPQYAMA